MSFADIEKQIWEGNEELSGALREALKPEPLSDDLVGRIQADWDGRWASGRSLRLRHWTWAAAAAACVLALVWPGGHGDSSHENGMGVVALSTDEAALIVAAYGVLSWDDTVDYSIAAVDVSLDDLDASLRGGSVGAAIEDDWDLPASDSGETGLFLPADSAGMRSV